MFWGGFGKGLKGNFGNGETMAAGLGEPHRWGAKTPPLDAE